MKLSIRETAREGYLSVTNIAGDPLCTYVIGHNNLNPDWIVVRRLATRNYIATTVDNLGDVGSGGET
jgi:hypothetical protein